MLAIRWHRRLPGHLAHARWTVSGLFWRNGDRADTGRHSFDSPPPASTLPPASFFRSLPCCFVTRPFVLLPLSPLRSLIFPGSSWLLPARCGLTSCSAGVGSSLGLSGPARRHMCRIHLVGKDRLRACGPARMPRILKRSTSQHAGGPDQLAQFPPRAHQSLQKNARPAGTIGTGPAEPSNSTAPLILYLVRDAGSYPKWRHGRFGCPPLPRLPPSCLLAPCRPIPSPFVVFCFPPSCLLVCSSSLARVLFLARLPASPPLFQMLLRSMRAFVDLLAALLLKEGSAL